MCISDLLSSHQNFEGKKINMKYINKNIGRVHTHTHIRVRNYLRIEIKE